jgi:hypothetical protein
VPLLSFSRCCTQPWWLEIVQIGFDGFLLRKDYSRSGPSSAHWLALMVDTFLGRLSGRLRLIR